MGEVAVKTHLIITNIHEEYEINWCARIIDTKPLLRNGKPQFLIISKQGRIELNTLDIKELERNAKILTYPKGRTAVTSDSSYIYIKEIEDKETLIGIVTHKRIKKFAPMYDKFDFQKKI